MNTIQSRVDGETVGTTLRMPRELRDEMKIQAIKAGRSFNTHVVMLLKEAIPADAQRVDRRGIRTPLLG